jgi:hypothetical protein
MPVGQAHFAGVRLAVCARKLSLARRREFTTEQPDPHRLREIMGEVRDALPNEWQSEEMDRWWIGWCWTSLDAQSHDFLFSASTDADTLARTATDTVINVLSDRSLWQRIVKADKALGS